MKETFSLWLCQTLLILLFRHITICHAVDLSESDDFVRSKYEEPNSNNRRRYYTDPDNANRVNQNYETAYTDGERRTNLQDYLGRTGSGTKFTKPANLRKALYSELRKAYDTKNINTRNGDTSEVDTAGDSSTEKGDFNDSVIHDGDLANKTAFSSVTTLVKSNFPKQPDTDSCTCQGSGANKISFLCFSSRDGSNNLSIKYKGTTMFNIEDIIKAYKFYFDNMQVHNFNFEHVLNSENNFKHEFEGDNKFNIDVGKFKINEGNFNFNAESKFDINEVKEGDHKFKANTFDKFDVAAIKEDSKKNNFDFYNNFKTQFEKKFKSKSEMEAWKKIKEIAESKKNHQFSFNNSFSSNQQHNYEMDVQADTQAKIKAQAKALAQAEAFAKAQAIFEAQLKAKAKAQAVLQNKITAQAQAEAEAQIRAQAKAEAEAQVNAQMQTYGQTQVNSQSNSHVYSYSDNSNKGHLNNVVNLGIGGEKKIFGNGFSMGFNGAFGAANSGMSYGKQIGGAFSFGGGGGAAIGLGGGGSAAIGLGGGGSAAIGLSGRVPFTAKSNVGGNDGSNMAYTGGEGNYEVLYDESSDDGSWAAGYPGVIAFSSSNDNPITSGRFYNNGDNKKDGFTAFGHPGYKRHP